MIITVYYTSNALKMIASEIPFLALKCRFEPVLHREVKLIEDIKKLACNAQLFYFRLSDLHEMWR